MDVTKALVAQVDPLALRLWNQLADGHNEVLQPLTDRLCAHFPSFCGLLLKVRPKGGGWLSPFLFNEVQRRMWREICKRIERNEPIWFTVLKFRQAGMSTFWCAWIFWQIWRQHDIQAMFVAHKNLTAETMIEMMRVFYDCLPDAFKPDLRKGNHGETLPRGEVYLADRRSWCMIHLAKDLDPRGQQVTHVIETEHASYPNAAQLNSALKPQLPPFGSDARKRSTFIIESTPKGQNEFHDVYKKARDGELADTRALFFPWFLFDEQYAAACPIGFKLTNDEKAIQKRLTGERMKYSVEDGGGKEVTREQMYWRRQTIADDMDGDEEMFDQEYPSDDISCWMIASKSVFKEYGHELLAMADDANTFAKEAWSRWSVDGKTVETQGPVRLKFLPKIDRQAVFTPMDHHIDFQIHAHGPWLVWEPPAPGHKYCVGGDPAMGVEGGDASCISVIDATTGHQVAEFCEQIGPEEMAIEMAAAGYWYNFALLVPEVNSIGYVLLKQLGKNITYGNLYRWPKWDEAYAFSKKRGFETNNRTKQIMVAALVHYFDSGIINVASPKLVGELSTFEQIREDENYIVFGAQRNRHDDRVMAFGLAVMGIEQSPALLTEISRVKSRIPSASELHLAPMPGPEQVIPKAIADLISVRHKIPWNCFSEEMPV